ncbi:hypothetical protein CgunFtcFv8_023348 [Champsocephalus gunnari]|uniref:Uncharacterized protein n=1 Tax=Champsocephalus gunnari TaxID=52237 RepID=A0AAN8DG03_CHAGU|nr:hypothetical protein CgunFtcFv8_023348 [Champsocephalus gunnari]
MTDDHNYAVLRPRVLVCSGGTQNNMEYPQLKGWLPGEFRYQVKEWVQKLKGSSGVTWRVDVTRPRLGKRVLFKASYKCQHRVNPRAAKSSKNTCCQAKMHTTLKSTRGEMKTEDPHMPDLPFKVILINRHNHNLFVAHAIRH